jgi:hypothetical protein
VKVGKIAANPGSPTIDAPPFSTIGDMAMVTCLIHKSSATAAVSGDAKGDNINRLHVRLDEPSMLRRALFYV